MIKKEDCIKTILARVPAFRTRWQAHLNYWTGEEAGLCNDVSAFSDFVAHLIVSRQTGNLREIFSVIEDLMNEGDQNVKDAIATCCLENLINKTPDGINPDDFVPLLGPSSRAYCKAWDEFTGVRTKGL